MKKLQNSSSPTLERFQRYLDFPEEAISADVVMPNGDPELQSVQIVLEHAGKVPIQSAVFGLEFGEIVEGEGLVVARILRFPFHFRLLRVDSSQIARIVAAVVVIVAP